MNFRPAVYVSATVLALVVLSSVATAQKKPKAEVDPYAEYVWPPPPDTPRIKLETVITGRADVEGGGSKWKKALIGASPQSPYDRFEKPMAVAFDPQGRILVTDWATGALIRFDLDNDLMDVLGTKGQTVLKQPLGLDVGPDGTIFVADGGQSLVVAFDPTDRVGAVFGREGELQNPTDAALSPDGANLFVTDAKAHEVVVFDVATGQELSRFGGAGSEPGQLAFPSSLTFGPEGDLLVVDQLNSRVQLLMADGEYLDSLGSLGMGYGQLVRPKDVAVDEVGFIYVTDFAFNNFQLFDADFTLLTFVGEGGGDPGRFQGISGIDVQGDWIAVVDQLGKRLQIFRFLVPKTAE